jgi:protein O-GlcNAc transferase
MGCPVLTCIGNTFAGRVAAILLRAAGTPELVTETLKEYTDLAVHLGNTPLNVAELRQRLSQHRTIHSLFDTEQHVSHLEEAFTRMYEREQLGLPPESFDVLLTK